MLTRLDIHDVVYNNVYTQNSNQMYMFKSYGGSGTVANVELKNFIGHSNAYTLDLDATWSSMSPIDGDGILYTNFTFSGWAGTCLNGHQRGPIKLNCPPDVPCTDLSVTDFNVWTEAGDYVEHWCNNAFGDGACLDAGNPTSTFTTTQTVSSVSDYSIATMAGEITVGLGLTASIAIPTLRASFYPGVAAISPLMANGDSDAVAETTAAAVASSADAVVTSVAAESTDVAVESDIAVESSSIVVESTSIAVESTDVAEENTIVATNTPSVAVSSTLDIDFASFTSIVTSTPVAVISASQAPVVSESGPETTTSATRAGSSACKAARRRRHI